MSEPLVVAADCDETGVLRLDLPRAQYQALVRARFAGQRVDLEVRARKSKRSLEQNKWLHAAFTGWIRDTLPEYQQPSLADGLARLKAELLGLVFGYHTYQSRLTGEIRTVLQEPHTSALNTRQFCELMDEAIMQAAKTGHVIEEPDEWKARMAAERAKRAQRKVA